MDRAVASGATGRGFESLQAYQTSFLKLHQSACSALLHHGAQGLIRAIGFHRPPAENVIGNGRTWASCSKLTGTPSRKLTRLPEFEATRSPAATIPMRFSGSAAETVTISLDGPARREARSDSTATGKANCSPRKPSTKRPPRTSPRSSRRLKTTQSARQATGNVSRPISSRKTTP